MDAEDGKVESALALAAAAGRSGGSRRPPDPKLRRSNLNRIGQVLRAEDNPIMRVPVPEHLLALLKSTADESGGQ
jgi:hypothetical protein